MNVMLMHLNNEIKELNIKLEYADKFEKALGHMIKISESEGAQAGLQNPLGRKGALKIQSIGYQASPNERGAGWHHQITNS